MACDFFEAITLTGVRMYVFAAIEHASRRIRILGATAHPTAAWVTQAARNLAMDLDDAGTRARYLIRDRDGKFPALFDTILADAGITVVLSGIQVPRMNSIMERWIQPAATNYSTAPSSGTRRTCSTLCASMSGTTTRTRPHRGIANARPLRPLPQPITDQASITHLHIHRRDRLSGLLNEYEHAA
jgi:putative transposase